MGSSSQSIPPVAVWLTSSGIDADFGGIASVTRSCLRSLRPGNPSEDHGISRFLALFDPAPEQRPGDGLDELPGIRYRSCGHRRWQFACEVFRQAFEKPSLVMHDHVDLAQCQTLLPKPLRQPYVVWCHGIELWRELPPRKTQALKEADALFFNSAFTREKASQFHPWILDCPHFVIPLCREPAPDSGSTNSEGLDRKPWILTVGRLLEDRPKGHVEILAVLPRLIEAVPDLHWHIVGKGPWKDSLAALISESPARDHITLHGFVSDAELDRFYRESRVFAMPSYGEGFGLVYAEAMARGLPCVGSTLDAAPEVLGKAGSCVDPRVAPDLIEALLTYLTASPSEFAAFSEKAGQRAQHFELPRFTDDLRSAVSQTIRRAAKAPG